LEHQLKQLEGCRYELTLHYTREDLQPHFDDAYKNIQKTASIQGFRRGKAPLEMIKRIYGKAIEADTYQDLINKEFYDLVKKEKIRFTGEPELVDVKIEEDGSVTYFMNLDILPGVELKDYTSIVIDEPVHVVGEDEINDNIDKLCREYGEFEDSEVIEDENCVVEIKSMRLDSSTRLPIQGEEALEDSIDLYMPNVDPELKTNLIGRNVNDIFELIKANPQNPNEIELIQVEVVSINKSIPAEFDDELVKKYTQNKFENTEDYRQEIAFRMQEYWDGRSREAMESNLIKEVLELHGEFPIPDSAVMEAAKNTAMSYLQDMTKQEPKEEMVSDEMLEYFRPMASRAVRWEIIKDEIVKKEGIEVEDYDLEAFAAKQAAQYNIPVEQFLNIIRENAQIKAQILNSKVIDLLMDYAETREVDFQGKPLEDNDEVETVVADETKETKENIS
jgi:trigger factor